MSSFAERGLHSSIDPAAGNVREGLFRGRPVGFGQAQLYRLCAFFDNDRPQTDTPHQPAIILLPNPESQYRFGVGALKHRDGRFRAEDRPNQSK
jgi:hypothetical protein